MATIADRLPRSLGARIFLLTGAIVLGALGAAVGFTAWRASEVARDSVRESLISAVSAQNQFARLRSAQLRLISRFAAGDPSFVAYVADGDPASVRDLLLERQRDLECDFAAVLDRQGRLIASTGPGRGAGTDLASHPLVAAALRTGEGAGPWTEGDRVYAALAVPLLSGGDTVQGILVTGFLLDDDLALQIKRQSGAETAFLTRGTPPRVIASTLAAGDALVHALAAKGGAAALVRRGVRNEPTTLELDGRRWAALATPIFGADDPDGVDGITLASIDGAIAPFRRIESALLWVGALALVIAFALSYWLSRRVTRPIEALVAAAESARLGQYDHALANGADDEVGRLARAFDALLTDLREEREMQAWLQALSRTLPQVAPPKARPEHVSSGALFANRFEIQSVIGEGGMGVVYRARDRQLNDVVALKTLRPGATDPNALENLKSELRLARRITHRHVLRTHDFGEADGVPFISMEFVRGVTLRELLDHTGRVPVSVALRLGRQLLGGLEAAHSMGIVHRDIKPENLIVEPNGHTRIMDFGIARSVRVGSSIDAVGSAGTLGYLSPEQLRGEPGDARSDLYAVGVVLYEILCGRRPYLAANPLELSYRQMNEDPPPLREIDPALPEELELVVMRSLARDPARRWGSAAELSAALAAVRS